MDDNLTFFMKSFGMRMRNAGRVLINGYKSALSLNPEGAVEIYKDMGTSYEQQGNYSQAVDMLTKAAEHAPDDAEIHTLLGRAHLAQKHLPQAQEEFEKAVALSPDADLYTELAKIYAHLEQPAKAIAALKKGLAANPTSPDIHYQMGLAYDKKKDYPKAVSEFKQAIEISPQNAHYHFSLGFTLDSKGDREEALDVFKKAVALENK
ncbi:MAG: hypothetical protein COB53_10795 [Elusimicrobia bacterium]|nr:MAG: hypothetical protein COB53_10795 [Elusimicrobiota bacterium]